MKIACIVLGAVAVVLGIVIVIVLLCDRKNKQFKAETEGQTDVETAISDDMVHEAADIAEADGEEQTDVETAISDDMAHEAADIAEADGEEQTDDETVISDDTPNEAADTGEVDGVDSADSPLATATDETSDDDTDEESDTASDADDSENDEFTELKAVVKDGVMRYIVIKYSKSFQAKLIQSADETKDYYSQLKNCLMSYGVKSRMSWKWESFRFGRKTLAKFRLRGKTLSLLLALDPNDYADTKYHVESVADIACYADTPCLYRIKNDRRLRYAQDLIAKLMQDNGVTENASAENADYVAKFPYETTDALIGRKLIKVLTDADAQSGDVFMPSDLRKSVSAQEVDEILQDEVAAELIEKGDGITDKTKVGIVNIDTLSQYFIDGETVTLGKIKKRIKGFTKTTYIKVLARGVLDKKLTVEADDFSLQAVKMIVLIGGKVIKK